MLVVNALGVWPFYESHELASVCISPKKTLNLTSAGGCLHGYGVDGHKRALCVWIVSFNGSLCQTSVIDHGKSLSSALLTQPMESPLSTTSSCSCMKATGNVREGVSHVNGSCALYCVTVHVRGSFFRSTMPKVGPERDQKRKLASAGEYAPSTEASRGDSNWVVAPKYLLHRTGALPKAESCPVSELAPFTEASNCEGMIAIANQRALLFRVTNELSPLAAGSCRGSSAMVANQRQILHSCRLLRRALFSELNGCEKFQAVNKENPALLRLHCTLTSSSGSTIKISLSFLSKEAIIAKAELSRSKSAQPQP